MTASDLSLLGHLVLSSKGLSAVLEEESLYFFHPNSVEALRI